MSEFMTTVVIVDDHPIVRAGMRAILEAEADISVVGEGTQGADALRLVEDLCPNVLALDLQLPDLSGLEVTRQLHAQGRQTAILILTAHNDQETIFSLLESGALGYVLKDEALETLVRAVRAAARGESWFSPAIASQVMRRAISLPRAAPAGVPEILTPRELDTLKLLARGLDNTAIAQKLVVTKRTVQNHVSTIYAKLGVTSRAEAMLYALRHGLAQVSREEITLDDS
jgi:two-component system response regulator DegU